jgi:hypothetical protein
MKIKLFLSLALTLSVWLTGCTSPNSTAGITVRDCWVRYADPTGAAYFAISNSGNSADRLLSVSSDIAMNTEMHESAEANGVMSMAPVEAVTIPAGGQVEFKPGSYHIMLMGFNRELKVGDTVTLTLNFEKAGAVTVACDVRDQ